MKKTLLTFVVLFLCFLASAQNYYVSPTGSDAANGTQATPWKTLRNALLTVTPGTGNKTIYLLPGTYTETASTLNLPVGVNLEGLDAATTIVKTGMTGQWSTFMNLESSSLTNGNQRVKKITFDGQYVSASNYKTWFGVWVTLRSNVTFDSCVFQNFFQRGMIINGNGFNEQPTDPGIYSTGIKVTNCRFLNCGGNDGHTYGQLNIGGTKAALIQNNYFNQTQRPGTTNGECIKYWGSGYNPGLKIDNNDLIRANHVDNQYNGNNGDWNFAVELFNNEGLEFSNNRVQGSLDLNYQRRLTNNYAYSVYIHDNTFNHNPVNNKEEQAIIFEFGSTDFIVENNKFLNQSTGITFNVRPPNNNGGFGYPAPTGGHSATTNGRIKNNLFTLYNLGNNICCSRQGLQFYIEGETKTAYGRNIEISNNTFVNLSPAQQTCIDLEYFGLQSNGTPALSGLTVKNNIFIGFTARYLFGGASMANVTISNNCVWNCGNNNNAVWNGVSFSESTNLKVNPGLDANYQVPQGSPIYGQGIGYQSTGTPPPPPACTFSYGPWVCNGTVATRTYTASPAGCTGTPPADSLSRPCSLPNVPPVANAGPDKSITLPTNSVTLNGTCTDSDGTVQSYQWTQLSGPSVANIALVAGTCTSNVTFTTSGTYNFQLRVTDNSGATATDTVQVIVNAAPPPTKVLVTTITIHNPDGSVNKTIKIYSDGSFE